MDEPLFKYLVKPAKEYRLLEEYQEGGKERGGRNYVSETERECRVGERGRVTLGVKEDKNYTDWKKTSRYQKTGDHNCERKRK